MDEKEFLTDNRKPGDETAEGTKSNNGADVPIDISATSLNTNGAVSMECDGDITKVRV